MENGLDLDWAKVANGNKVASGKCRIYRRGYDLACLGLAAHRDVLLRVRFSLLVTFFFC